MDCGEETWNYVSRPRGEPLGVVARILAFDGEDYVINLDPRLVKDENIDKLMDLFKKNHYEIGRAHV